MSPIGGIGIELWTMQSGILFDNILVSTKPDAAKSLADGTFVKRKALEEVAKKEKEKSDRPLPKSDNFVGKVKYFFAKARYFVQDNALAVGLAVCLGLVPLLLYCCWPSKDAEDAAAPTSVPAPTRAPEASSSKEGDEGEEEPEPEEDDAPIQDVTEEKEKPSPAKGAARKRTPKAS